MPAPQKRSTYLGITMMLVGILLFSMNDAMGKWLVATYSVGQVLVLRSIAALLALSPFIAKEGVANVMRPDRPVLQTLRVVFSSAEVAFFYYAVAYLPLADVMTYWLAGPVWAVVIAALFLGERVKVWHWLAVLIGFLGVVVALQPSAATLTWPAIVAIIGSFLFAAMVITGRQLRGTADITLVTWQNIGALIMGFAMLLPFGWVETSWRDAGLLGLLGVVAMLGHICVTRSLKLAPASTVVPYQYTLIIWAVLFGWFFFDELPTLAMALGSALIITAGLALLFLEQKSGPASEPIEPP